MGAVNSRPDDNSFPIYLRDQSRFAVSALTVTNSRGHVLLRAAPNAYPAGSYSVQKDVGDESPVEYIQDPESLSSGIPSFLVRFFNHDELTFNFTFVLRQSDLNGSASAPSPPPPLDTQISGLTYIFASNQKEVENLVVREFHSNPNLHKNPNVELVGDYSTDGHQSVQFTWSWKWRPAKPSEDRGGGWRTTCSFAEYDQRAHRLNTLATFSFWVQNVQRSLAPLSPRSDLGVSSTRLRVPSAQSIESRVSNVSDSEGEGSYKDYKEPQSPIFESIPENALGLTQSSTNLSTFPGSAVKVDVATCKPGEDPISNDDGPLFRATMRSLEQKTGNMRLRMKKVLRTAEAAEAAQRDCNQAVSDFTEALKEAASSNANAVRPALEHYFEKIAKEILLYERENTINLQKLIIDPISRLYNIEIKSADYKKREFDEESKEYYAYVSKYLGQRSESLKEKKQKQSDEKYQAKRRTFELKRFDYSSFMHDLHGGRKDQEVLSQLTKYADAQTRSYLATAKKVEEMVPQLDALVAEVKAADQDFQLQRTEREEKRRMLEKSTKIVNDDAALVSGLSHTPSASSSGLRSNELDHARNPSPGVAAAFSQSPPSTANTGQTSSTGMLGAPTNGMAPSLSSSPGSKFRGIRDLEENSAISTNGTQRKEGLLWALSRPGLHVDPKGITKPGWHKFWIVLDQGKLSEYVNWKDKLDLHMDPIDLRVASVREARNSDRRFCFEVITPQYTRVYQAPSEEDMKAWIGAINNALQSAFEAKGNPQPSPSASVRESSTRKDIAAVLTGKSSSFSGHRQISNPNRREADKAVNRHATVGDRPAYKRDEMIQPETSALLQRMRSADEGNKICADCGTDAKVDWCSINLGVLLCIECSGIHRSLGTHVSKVRSLTLDTSVFTQDIVELLLLIGNRISNMVWEAKLDRFLKPSPHSTREQRLHFITAKYNDRTYVQASTMGTQSADELLLTSIKRNDISSVLHALALKANPNATDRSRSTHAVYLALAAADPASPASTLNHSPNPSISNISKSVANGTPSVPTLTSPRKPFPVAELLLQNGAEIPTDPAPILLSTAAQSYITFKNDQKLGKIVPAAGAKDGNGDSLSALPSFGGGSMSERAKDRERLIKRNSGGRTSRSGITADVLEGFVKK